MPVGGAAVRALVLKPRRRRRRRRRRGAFAHAWQGEATEARLRLRLRLGSLGFWLPWGCSGTLVLPAMHSAGPQRAESHLSKQQEKDAELDRRIAALRKKNQALLRRYQEIQEDQRLAEQGGTAGSPTEQLQPDGLTITISQVPGRKRVVSQNWVRRLPGPGAAEDSLEDDEAAGPAGAFCLGERVELAVTMENKAKAKRIVSEKPLGARSQGTWGQTQPASSSASARKAAREPWSPGQGAGLGSGRSPPEVGWDYAQWKQEREQIDQARLARHKDAHGEWRRPWDLDKAAPMAQHFSKPREEGLARAGSARGPRSPRKLQPSLSPPGGKGGTPRGGQAGRPSGAAAPRNKAWGMERLTGRARRWDAKEDKEPESQERGQSRNSEDEKVKPQKPGGPPGPKPGSPPSPCPASTEGPKEESAASPATAVPLSPPRTDLAPLDLSLGGASSLGSRESMSVLGPKPGAQESPVTQPGGSEQPSGSSVAPTRPEVQTCSESPRGSGSPETRSDSQADAQQGLAPRNRPTRGSGQRTRGTERGRSRTGGPGHAGRC
ncbi:LOW QUALITY PROTEIN: coiled-coil domain-containing protein 9B [Sorex fumeus]|uniref:LOW QUALITY PROTEIN: coiled-coil domain-containing protein 9B n=1 Tax=Sorex fumeus TaxID=62283 RepID=UPI0024AD2B37|nr:LOW QUALITY PROTEIN: coiled-coil domain-containing protein 9B [Sorex fumeus]